MKVSDARLLRIIRDVTRRIEEVALAERIHQKVSHHKVHQLRCVYAYVGGRFPFLRLKYQRIWVLADDAVNESIEEGSPLLKIEQ